MEGLHVAVVGYGSAGQALAVLLSRQGHRVEVFERVAEPGPVGAGFLLQPTGMQVLWKMGLLDSALEHGAPIRRLYGDTPGGRGVMDMAYAGLDRRMFGLGLQRGALFQLLDRAWTARCLHAGTAIEEVDADGGRIRDTHGRWHGPFDLVVAADGASSALRASTAGVRSDRVYPWGALWCLLPADGWAFADELRQRYVRARKMIGVLPVGTRPGDATPRVSFFWSLPCADFERWRQDGMAAWKDEVAGLWPELGAHLAGLAAPDQLARAGYRDAVLARWFRGRLAVVGDAAHAMSPQLGQGVNMALMDAWALADALRQAGDLADALRRYQRERRRHVAIYQFWSRWLTPVFQSDHDLAARLRDACLLPLGRLPGGRGQMLRVLTGTRQGWLGALALDPQFLAALASLPARWPDEGAVHEA
jgi:2-polyprenyl-6-methoxyphenol hydroxylase-like FAD-dependent oxidoreductase